MFHAETRLQAVVEVMFEFQQGQEIRSPKCSDQLWRQPTLLFN